MKFRFRLASVLRYRERQRDACAAAVKEALTALQHAREREREQAIEVRRLYAAVHRGDDGPTGGVGLWLLQTSYVAHARTKRRRRQQVAVAAEATWAAERQRLVAADRACEMLSQLEARQRARWRATEKRRQTRILDEIASVRAARQRAAEYAATRLA